MEPLPEAQEPSIELYKCISDDVLDVPPLVRFLHSILVLQTLIGCQPGSGRGSTI